MKNKNVIQVMAIITAILFFAPTFSTSDIITKITFSAARLVPGLKLFGITVVKPMPLVLLCLIMPILIMVLWMAGKAVSEKLTTGLTVILAIGEIVCWVILRRTIYKNVLSSFDGFKTTTAYKIIVILSVIMIVMALLDLAGITEKAGSAKADSAGNMAGNENMSADQSKTRYCPNCGTKLPAGSRFCSKCGNQIYLFEQ